MHLVAAIVIGVFGYRFVTRPPEVLEVTLSGSGGSQAADSEEIEEQVEQEDNSIMHSIDDIIDKRLKPEIQHKKSLKRLRRLQPITIPPLALIPATVRAAELIMNRVVAAVMAKVMDRVVVMIVVKAVAFQ